MNSHSDDKDCFGSIDFDGNKIIIDISGPIIGVKFEEKSNYVYMSVHETKHLIHVLKSAAAKAEESMRRNQETTT